MSTGIYDSKTVPASSHLICVYIIIHRYKHVDFQYENRVNFYQFDNFTHFSLK